MFFMFYASTSDLTKKVKFPLILDQFLFLWLLDFFQGFLFEIIIDEEIWSRLGLNTIYH